MGWAHAWTGSRTKGVAVTNLGAPAPDQVHLVLGGVGNLRIPSAHEIDIVVYPLGLDLVKDDRVHVFASGQDLAETRLDLGLHLPTLLGAVDEVGEGARLAIELLLLGLGGESCIVLG